VRPDAPEGFGDEVVMRYNNHDALMEFVHAHADSKSICDADVEQFGVKGDKVGAASKRWARELIAKVKG